MRVIRCGCLLLGLMAALVGTGCHDDVQEMLVQPRMISIADKFYDVEAIDAERAVVVGYGGKILTTADGGYTWSSAAANTDRALYSVHFVDADYGWIAGQEGLVLHTTDGGATWQPQKSPTNVYLFSVFFLDRNRGWIVGDRSILLETRDGGARWKLRKIETQQDLSPEEAIASQDPVLYDIEFLSPDVGWIVGEFGKILHTRDGGKNWEKQEESLLGEEIFDVLDIPTFFGVRFLNEREGVVSGLDGRIARTRDGGASWAFDPMNLEYPIVDPLFTPALFPDGAGWAVGAAGEVLRLPAGGGKWQRVDLGMKVLTWLRGMDWLDGENGWIVGGYGLILHTKDGGKTWLPAIA